MKTIIGTSTKAFIIDEMPSTSQYILSDVIDLLIYKKDTFNSDTYAEDLEYLRALKKDSITYIELSL